MNLPRTRKPDRRNETAQLTHPIRAALNKLPGVRVARNNVGSLEWAPGKMLRYGLGEGSADLVGIVRITDVTVVWSKPVGRAFALEVKWPGEKPTEDQERWMSEVRKLGGFACIVHSVEEAIQAVDRCRSGASQ